MKIYPPNLSAGAVREHRPIVGYGDLVRLFATCPDRPASDSETGNTVGGQVVSGQPSMAAKQLARALGFGYSPRERVEINQVSPGRNRTDGKADLQPDHPTLENPDGLQQLTDGWPDQRQPVALWQVQAQTSLAAPASNSAGHGPDRGERAELNWRGRPKHPLPWRPLAPWSVVETRLRRILSGEASGRELDVPAVSRWLAELRVDRPIPRRAVRRWGGDVQVLVDSSEHLQPYFDDQQMVLNRLQKLLGLRNEQVFFGTDPGTRPDGSDFYCWRSDTERVSWRTPPAGTRVLLLSDLGALGRQKRVISERWWQLGQYLTRRQCLAMALVPCNLSSLWERLAEYREVCRGLRQNFQINSWAAELPSPRDVAARQQLVDRIAGCLSFTIRMEPQLLRRVRLLWPLAGDPGLEADVWQHPLLIGHSSVAATPQSGALTESLLAGFEREPESIRRAVLEVWRACRSHTAPEIYLEELGRLTQNSIQLCPAEDYEDVVAAWRYFERQAAAADHRGGDLTVHYAARAIQRAVGELNVNSPVAALIGRIRNHLREHDGQQIQHAGDRIDVFQHGRDLILRSVNESQAEPERMPRHSRLTTMRCQGDAIRILSAAGKFEKTLHVPLGVVRACRLPDVGTLEIRTDTDHVRLGRINRPSWATSFGRDDYGLWSETRVRGVVVRWRWIPPGEFKMGSPESEDGRYPDEGPCHRVRLTRGFWMMSTVCTQSFWEAVLGADRNPSEFRGGDRPVENVSWEDVQAFVLGLESALPGLGASLPTEAQWEYACRAGSTGALYRIPGILGTLEIIGKNNGPELDAIAWYGGNSGEGFELANGADSRSWPEKQYEHESAGTHPVGRKLPNAWGLYDMLGNVWEWCLDGQRDYSSASIADPVGPSVESRVIRGGGWLRHARGVRCASRNQYSPGFGYNFLGFRLVRVQE